jgi:hypothetical protein
MKKYQIDLSGRDPVISLVLGQEGAIGSYEICSGFSVLRKGTVGYVVDPPLAFMSHDDVVMFGKGHGLPFVELDEIRILEKEYRHKGLKEEDVGGARKISRA